jgi:integrating conjugative element protein (TIGR03761 family)
MNEQDKNNQPAKTRSESSGDSPGELRSDVTIMLQTFQAHKLVHGRRSDRDNGVVSIVGLLEFGRRMKLIWMSAEQDDPFADWYLLEIEQLLEKARESIAHAQDRIEKSLGAMEGVGVQIAESELPILVKLQLNNP